MVLYFSGAIRKDGNSPQITVEAMAGCHLDSMARLILDRPMAWAGFRLAPIVGYPGLACLAPGNPN
jgi:hypothetical protein